MRCVVLIGLFGLAACHTAKAPVVAKTQSWAEFVRARPDNFVQTYSDQLAKNRSELAASGLAEEHAAVRSYVDAYLPAGQYTLQSTGATAAVQRRLRVDSLTNNLVNYGYRRRHFADPTAARRLVRAVAGMSSSTSDSDLALVAPTVVIADLDRVDEPADGSAALVYRVVEPIKNSPAKGAIIRLTVRAAAPPSPFPPPPQPDEGELRLPGRVALFLSPPRPIGGSRATADAYARITQPMRLDGKRLLPGYHSDVPEITLERLRAVVREQVCAPGYVAVGPGGVDLAC